MFPILALASHSLQKSLRQGDVSMTYWTESGKMITEMVWENFEGPQLPEEDQEVIGELNRKIENDNVRMCFSWKPVESKEF